MRDYWHDVVVFSPNYHGDDSYEPLRRIEADGHEDDPAITVLGHYDEDKLAGVIKTLEENRGDRSSPTLLVFDDVIGSIPKHSLAYALASRSRHLNASLVFSTQKFVEVPRIARDCTSEWWVLGINPEESKKVGEACPWSGIVDGLRAAKHRFGPYAWVRLNRDAGVAWAGEGFTDEDEDVVWRDDAPGLKPLATA